VIFEYIYDAEYKLWDDYATRHPQGNVYQHSFWGKAISQSYGHQVYYLTAARTEPSSNIGLKHKTIVGILPLVHIKNFLFGNCLYSMPYADLGGLLADNPSIELELLHEALKLARKHDIPLVKLRQANPSGIGLSQNQEGYRYQIESQQKVRMLLELPESSEQLMQSFKSKLRSQIHRPLKEGLKAISGSIELMRDFYAVFSENMRDLGSPVHSKTFLNKVVELAGKKARVFIVYSDKQPLACSMTLASGDILANPWASSLHRFSSTSPNMLLYWAMLEYGCDHGFKYFDFGRSTPGEGTYKFKAQWGCIEKPLHWVTFSNQDHQPQIASVNQKSRFNTAMYLWKRTPVSITKIVGPILRKNIGL
jgi:serine/alanine adding enzyme